MAVGVKKLELCPYQIVKKCDDMSIRLDTIPALDRQRNKRTDRRTDRFAITISVVITTMRLQFDCATTILRYGPPAVRSVTLNLSNFSEVTK